MRSPPLRSTRHSATVGRVSPPPATPAALSPMSPTHRVWVCGSYSRPSGSSGRPIRNGCSSTTSQSWFRKKIGSRASNPKSWLSLTTMYWSPTATMPDSSTRRGSLISQTGSPGTGSGTWSAGGESEGSGSGSGLSWATAAPGKAARPARASAHAAAVVVHHRVEPLQSAAPAALSRIGSVSHAAPPEAREPGAAQACTTWYGASAAAVASSTRATSRVPPGSWPASVTSPRWWASATKSPRE